MGYDGLFFGRNDYADRHLRLNKTEMEMVWQPSRSLGDKVDLFTGILYYSIYGPPPGFCFDTKCTDPPIQVSVCVCLFVCLFASVFFKLVEKYF